MESSFWGYMANKPTWIIIWVNLWVLQILVTTYRSATLMVGTHVNFEPQIQQLNRPRYPQLKHIFRLWSKTERPLRCQRDMTNADRLLTERGVLRPQRCLDCLREYHRVSASEWQTVITTMLCSIVQTDFNVIFLFKPKLLPFTSSRSNFICLNCFAY